MGFLLFSDEKIEGQIMKFEMDGEFDATTRKFKSATSALIVILFSDGNTSSKRGELLHFHLDFSKDLLNRHFEIGDNI